MAIVDLLDQALLSTGLVPPKFGFHYSAPIYDAQS